MISKFIFGKPFNTESIVNLPACSKIYIDDKSSFPVGKIEISSEFKFLLDLDSDDMIFGLGENLGGINKRGKIYQSWCSDDPSQTEEKESLYGAHNFFIVYSPSKKEAFGFYFDYPGKLVIDAAYTKFNQLQVFCEQPDISVYFITPMAESKENGLVSITKQFRKMIGESYVAPYWSFGYMQSRWGYGSQKDLETVYENYKKNNISLDAIFLDIDYMDGFRDFTVNKTNFPNLKKCVNDLNYKGVHVVPIIDAGIKADADFEIDKEGLSSDSYCKKADGKVFTAAVWPGYSHFPDFLNPKARKWFGSKYKELIDSGIDGFWNDMNEPALFYSEDGMKDACEKIIEFAKNRDKTNSIISWDIKNTILNVQNNMEDYKSFYHSIPESMCGNFAEEIKNGVAKVRHDKVHNLYGYNMTRSAAEFFKEYKKDKQLLLISRASFIGMHRYSGIWTGDNCSWWSHILLCLKMLPSLNMCGFIYTGCDLGGFGCNTSRELLLRFMALGLFTPLMRNHSALGTREQECYRFENVEDFKGIIDLRYRLLPYLYSEYKKACINGTMYFKPLAFDYPEDSIARNTEDQLILGDSVMIAPVYTPNSIGRTVYLPESMYCISCKKENGGCGCGYPEQVLLEKGIHFIKCSSNEVVFFIKKNRSIPVVNVAENTSKIDLSKLEWWGDNKADKKYEFIK